MLNSNQSVNVKSGGIEVSEVETGGLPAISLCLPRDSLIAVTGPSGSGKSLFVRHTLLAESNRYLALAFPGGRSGRSHPTIMPRFKRIRGLPPVVEIGSDESRIRKDEIVSTSLGLDVEVERFIRRVGVLQCKNCGGTMSRTTVGELESKLKSSSSDSTVLIGAVLTPEIRKSLAKRDAELKNFLTQMGVRRLIVGHTLVRAEEPLPKRLGRNVLIAVTDTTTPREFDSARVSDALGRVRSFGALAAIVAVMPIKSSSNEVEIVGVLAKDYCCSKCFRTGEQEGEWHIGGIPAEKMRGFSADEFRKSFDCLLLQDEPLCRGLERLHASGFGQYSLARKLFDLSSGERLKFQILRATFLGLSDTLFFLDHPARLLHPFDLMQVVPLLRELVQDGNSVLVVEENLNFVTCSDFVLEFARQPKRGAIAYVGPIKAWSKRVASAERSNVSAEKSPPKVAVEEPAILPTAIVAVVGTAGSGKSRWLRTLAEKYGARTPNQKAFSTVRSIPSLLTGKKPKISENSSITLASAVGLAPLIAEVFAATPSARRLGLKADEFSLDSPSGRCSRCEGRGIEKRSLEWFGEEIQICEACLGARFSPVTLSIEVQGLSVRQILELNAQEALRYFDSNGEILTALRALQDLKLGEIPLGQSIDLLSTAERARVQLVKVVASKGKGAVLWLLEQPFADLEPEGVAECLKSLRAVTKSGSSIVFTTHDPAAIRQADTVIEFAHGKPNFAGTPDNFSLSVS